MRIHYIAANQQKRDIFMHPSISPYFPYSNAKEKIQFYPYFMLTFVNVCGHGEAGQN